MGDELTWEQVKEYLGFAWWCVTEDLTTTIVFAIGIVWLVAMIWSLA